MKLTALAQKPKVRYLRPMEERQVSQDGVTRALPAPFL